MKRLLWLILPLVLLSVVAAPVAAAPAAEVERIPPPPEWPIIGPVLRWLGIEEEVEPTPDLSLPEHQVATYEEAEALWRSLEPGERVRVVIAEEDVNAPLQEAVAKTEVLRHAEADFQEGVVVVNFEVDTAELRRMLEEEEAVSLPGFLMRGETFGGEYRVSAEAEACRPIVDVRGPGLFLQRRLLRRTLAQTWDEYGPSGGCIEGIFIGDGEVTVQGYK
ncbi:MAG: hypothetical protein ACLFU8_16050 [Anaerolineales bacterium]